MQQTLSPGIEDHLGEDCAEDNADEHIEDALEVGKERVE